MKSSFWLTCWADFSPELLACIVELLWKENNSVDNEHQFMEDVFLLSIKCVFIAITENVSSSVKFN